jgi:hypothetical protein
MAIPKSSKEFLLESTPCGADDSKFMRGGIGNPPSKEFLLSLLEVR